MIQNREDAEGIIFSMEIACKMARISSVHAFDSKNRAMSSVDVINEINKSFRIICDFLFEELQK
jgi:hypothetical protein